MRLFNILLALLGLLSLVHRAQAAFDRQYGFLNLLLVASTLVQPAAPPSEMFTIVVTIIEEVTHISPPKITEMPMPPTRAAASQVATVATTPPAYHHEQTIFAPVFSTALKHDHEPLGPVSNLDKVVWAPRAGCFGPVYITLEIPVPLNIPPFYVNGWPYGMKPPNFTNIIRNVTASSWHGVQATKVRACNMIEEIGNVGQEMFTAVHKLTDYTMLGIMSLCRAAKTSYKVLADQARRQIMALIEILPSTAAWLLILSFAWGLSNNFWSMFDFSFWAAVGCNRIRSTFWSVVSLIGACLQHPVLPWFFKKCWLLICIIGVAASAGVVTFWEVISTIIRHMPGILWPLVRTLCSLASGVLIQGICILWSLHPYQAATDNAWLVFCNTCQGFVQSARDARNVTLRGFDNGTAKALSLVGQVDDGPVVSHAEAESELANIQTESLQPADSYEVRSDVRQATIRLHSLSLTDIPQSVRLHGICEGVLHNTYATGRYRKLKIAHDSGYNSDQSVEIQTGVHKPTVRNDTSSNSSGARESVTSNNTTSSTIGVQDLSTTGDTDSKAISVLDIITGTDTASGAVNVQEHPTSSDTPSSPVCLQTVTSRNNTASDPISVQDLTTSEVMSSSFVATTLPPSQPSACSLETSLTPDAVDTSLAKISSASPPVLAHSLSVSAPSTPEYDPRATRGATPNTNTQITPSSNGAGAENPPLPVRDSAGVSSDVQQILANLSALPLVLNIQPNMPTTVGQNALSQSSSGSLPAGFTPRSLATTGPITPPVYSSLMESEPTGLAVSLNDEIEYDFTGPATVLAPPNALPVDDESMALDQATTTDDNDLMAICGPDKLGGTVVPSGTHSPQSNPAAVLLPSTLYPPPSGKTLQQSKSTISGLVNFPSNARLGSRRIPPPDLGSQPSNDVDMDTPMAPTITQDNNLRKPWQPQKSPLGAQGRLATSSSFKLSVFGHASGAPGTQLSPFGQANTKQGLPNTQPIQNFLSNTSGTLSLRDPGVFPKPLPAFAPASKSVADGSNLGPSGASSDPSKTLNPQNFLPSASRGSSLFSKPSQVFAPASNAVADGSKLGLSGASSSPSKTPNPPNFLPSASRGSNMFLNPLPAFAPAPNPFTNGFNVSASGASSKPATTCNPPRTFPASSQASTIKTPSLENPSPTTVADSPRNHVVIVRGLLAKQATVAHSRWCRANIGVSPVLVTKTSGPMGGETVKFTFADAKQAKKFCAFANNSEPGIKSRILTQDEVKQQPSRPVVPLPPVIKGTSENINNQQPVLAKPVQADEKERTFATEGTSRYSQVAVNAFDPDPYLDEEDALCWAEEKTPGKQSAGCFFEEGDDGRVVVFSFLTQVHADQFRMAVNAEPGPYPKPRAITRYSITDTPVAAASTPSTPSTLLSEPKPAIAEKSRTKPHIVEISNMNDEDEEKQMRHLVNKIMRINTEHAVPYLARRDGYNGTIVMRLEFDSVAIANAIVEHLEGHLFDGVNWGADLLKQRRVFRQLKVRGTQKKA